MDILLIKLIEKKRYFSEFVDENSLFSSEYNLHYAIVNFSLFHYISGSQTFLTRGTKNHHRNNFFVKITQGCG
jgi:hypothetical protein